MVPRMQGMVERSMAQSCQELTCHRNGFNRVLSVPKKKKPEASKREFHVGDQVRVKLHTGETVDATIKAIIEKTDGLRLQVDYEKDQTTQIHEWQVVENEEYGICG
jgi:transcription antitermination factor NusG